MYPFHIQVRYPVLENEASQHHLHRVQDSQVRCLSTVAGVDSTEVVAQSVVQPLESRPKTAMSGRSLSSGALCRGL